MANDGSMASKVEDWIIAQIQAIQFNGAAAFEAVEVKPWEGTESGTVGQFAEELMSATRDHVARVFFSGEETEELADSQIKLSPTYVVLIGIRNHTPAAARRGEVRGAETSWGTNAMRDLLQAAFNQKKPGVTAGSTITDKSHYAGADVVWHSSNLCIMRANVIVDEVPKAL